MVLDSGQSNFVAILVATTIHTNIYLEFKDFEVSSSLDPTNNSKNVSLKFHEFFDQWEQFYESFSNDFVIKNNLIDW